MAGLVDRLGGPCSQTSCYAMNYSRGVAVTLQHSSPSWQLPGMCLLSAQNAGTLFSPDIHLDITCSFHLW